MYHKEMITEEEAQQMCSMFNYFTNTEIMPLLSMASINLIPQACKGGTRLIYEIHLMQDTTRAFEFPILKERYYEVRATGSTLTEAMKDFSSKLNIVK